MDPQLYWRGRVEDEEKDWREGGGSEAKEDGRWSWLEAWCLNRGLNTRGDTLLKENVNKEFNIEFMVQ